MTALEWYEAACSEEGPTPEQQQILATHQRGIDSFKKGGFGEFRVMRVIEEMQQDGLIDDCLTDYQLPRVLEDSTVTRDGGLNAYASILVGENLKLDALKIDALVCKKVANNEHRYLPVQIKFSNKLDNKRTGGIILTQSDAAMLRRKYDLNHCFNNLRSPTQLLSVRNEYHVVHLGKERGKETPAHEPRKMKTKTELRTEIAEALNTESKTFALKKSIDQFSGIKMLETLLESGLLARYVPSEE